MRRDEPRQRALACFEAGGFSLERGRAEATEKPVKTGSKRVVSRRTSRKPLAYLLSGSRVNAAQHGLPITDHGSLIYGSRITDYASGITKPSPPACGARTRSRASAAPDDSISRAPRCSS